MANYIGVAGLGVYPDEFTYNTLGDLVRPFHGRTGEVWPFFLVPPFEPCVCNETSCEDCAYYALLRSLLKPDRRICVRSLFCDKDWEARSEFLKNTVVPECVSIWFNGEIYNVPLAEWPLD